MTAVRGSLPCVSLTPISLPGQTVIFDYGEVISLAPSAIAADIGASWDAARLHELWVADFRSCGCPSTLTSSRY